MPKLAGPGQELRALATATPVEPRGIARLLDGLTHLERVAAVRSLGRTQQRRLYAAVDGFLPLRLADLVAPSTADLVPVRHYGRNTLPAFTHFEKRFCRPRGQDREKPGELWGYNHQAIAWATGPGYFVAEEDPARPEVLIDYTRVPTGRAEGWPELRANERGLARFVYGFMIDRLRRVSEHVTIGSAARRGRDLGSWFALCREA
jgi:hypothetical protein